MNPQVEDLKRIYKEAKDRCDDAISVRNRVGLELAEAVASAPPEDEKPPPKRKPKKKAPPGGRKTNVDRAAKEYAGYEPKSFGCLCGCGEDCNGNFVRGHHHRLNAIVAAVDAEALDFEKIPTHAHDYVSKHIDCGKALKDSCMQFHNAALRDEPAE